MAPNVPATSHTAGKAGTGERGAELPRCPGHTMLWEVHSAQHVLISSGLLGDNQLALFVLLAAAALAFAVIWQRLRGQGPLERLLSMAAGRARLAVMTAPGQAGRSPTDVTDRAG